jgi:hypothetical protein
MSPAFVRKGMTKILQNSAFVSYASTFLHLQLRLTQFFAFFLQTRRLSRTSFSLQHFLLTSIFWKITELFGSKVLAEIICIFIIYITHLLFN